MTKAMLLELANDFIAHDEGNRIASSYAIDPSLEGIQMYDRPIIRFGSATDPYFDVLKQQEAIGPHFMKPREWLPNADTVISLFLPTSEAVRKNNRQDMDWPSPAWLHARIEGQAMIVKLNRLLRDTLIENGYDALSPLFDDRFFSREGLPGVEKQEPDFTSNWSERHVAFACGLGTFGLSKGLISEKGVAGRYTSIITNCSLPKDTRPYTDLYEYCSLCGACARNCPADAISIEKGKDHVKCSEYLNETRVRFNPRYGCGKCQVKVPCETKPCAKKAYA